MFKPNFVVLVATLLVIGNGWRVQGFNTSNSNNGSTDLSNADLNPLSNETHGLVSYVGWEGAKWGENVNMSRFAGELCNRQCVQGEHRICYFKFTVEFHQAMGVACGKCSQGVEKDCSHPQCIVGDGVEKSVMSINRQVPGPQIHVCKDDLIVVDVHNNAACTATTIHWHGIHQRETPHMDGVPFLTQCPIQFGTSFRYQFKASNPGTQFYHAHEGHHKTNGMYGVLTVRQPRENEPLNKLYDYDLPEHHIFIADWMHPLAEQLYPGLPSSRIKPDSVLINGRGVYTNPKTFTRTKVKPTIYYVAHGKRYRFRLVNSVNHVCPFQMQIERHNFSIIASDSFNVRNSTFDTLISNAGERYDFILEANQNIGDYWIRVKGIGLCATNPIESYALIRYFNENVADIAKYKEILKGLPIAEMPYHHDPFVSHTVLNHPDAYCWEDNSNQCVTLLEALDEDEKLRHLRPNHKIFLSINNYRYNHFQNASSNVTMVGAINQFSFTYPDYPPLTQPESIDENQFCDENHRPARCSDSQICYCTHRVKVKKDSIVELIIVNEKDEFDTVHHPFHLHGHKFMVIGFEHHLYEEPMTVKRAKELDSQFLLYRDYYNYRPPFKDTISIPSGGYAILLLRATNPGFWLLQSQYEWHNSIGMRVILQVGETSEMVKAPSDFPNCGNYMPSISSTLMSAHTST